MGYAVYEQGNRWAGYAVPAECDMPGCAQKIHRGTDYKCESWYEFTYFKDGEMVDYDADWDDEIEVEREDGCGFFFCEAHQGHHNHRGASVEGKPDSAEWLIHILNDESWAQWRELNPARCATYESRILKEMEEHE